MGSRLLRFGDLEFQASRLFRIKKTRIVLELQRMIEDCEFENSGSGAAGLGIVAWPIRDCAFRV